MQSDLVILCLSTYITVFTDSVSGQCRPRSTCVNAQACLGLRCPHCIRTLFVLCASNAICKWMFISLFLYTKKVWFFNVAMSYHMKGTISYPLLSSPLPSPPSIPPTTTTINSQWNRVCPLEERCVEQSYSLRYTLMGKCMILSYIPVITQEFFFMSNLSNFSRRFFLGAFWITKGGKFLLADNEDWSDWADAGADLCLRCAH